MACPIMIGNALAFSAGQFSLPIFFLSLLSGLLLQILANLINDYGDFVKGSDSKERLGPPRAMQMGWLTRRAMVQGIFTTMTLAVLCGFPLVLRGGWPILFMGVAGIGLCGWYTLGKRPLAYRGFAEIVIFFVFGPFAVMSVYYLQTLSLSHDALWISLSPGALSTALLLTNNLRDIGQDAINHKRTVAVRFGERFARCSIVMLVVMAALGPVIMYYRFSYSPVVLASVITLIIPAIYFKMILREPISRRFNLMLASLGKTLYLFGIVLSAGIIYGASERIFL